MSSRQVAILNDEDLSPGSRSEAIGTMELAARQVQFQALEKAALDLLLSSRISRAVLLAIILVFIDRICHFWKAAQPKKVLDQVDLEMSQETTSHFIRADPPETWPRLIGGLGKLAPWPSPLKG